MKKYGKRVTATLMAALMLTSTGPAVWAAEKQENVESVLSYYQNPDYTAKPMARMWFPDATAGMDDEDTIQKQIQALADAGFGGVEIAMLSDSTSYTNEQAEYSGWGTEEWNALLKKVYKAANAIEGGFLVDLTITAHWPPCVNTIDPNDDAASKQTAVSFTKVTAEDIEKGSVEIALPETKTTDGKGAYFVFTDTLASANLAKVEKEEDITEEQEDRQGNKTDPLVYHQTTLDFSSLKKVDTAEIEGKTTPAGVPDKAYCEEEGWDYQSVLDAFGPEQSNPDETAKVDADGNRKRLADEQKYYTADLSGLTAEDVADGDYVIVSVFYRGTGQLFNGGQSVVMHNRCYVMDFFDNDGIQAVTDYWDKNILADEELKNLISENGGSIFEDSIEANKTTNLWTSDLEEELKAYYGEDYAYLDVLAPVVASERTYGGFGASADPKDLVYTYDNEEEEALAQRIVEDYNSMMGYLYENQHCKPAVEWADTFGSTYRAQTYDLTGLDIAGAASMVDIPEGDNMTKGDGLRQLSASVNLYDKKFLSMEAITGSSIYKFNWEDILFELAANFSWGVNRAIFHGSAYSKAVNGYNADWPGWDPFGGAFGEPYTYRQIYWEDMNQVTDYVSRNQAILQYGQEKVDVAVVRDGAQAFENPSGNSFQSLLDNGYSYNIMSEALLDGENARKVEDGQIYRDGPGYKAVVLTEVSTISPESMEAVLDYAKAGIPVISYSSHPSKVYGTEKGENTDEKVQELYTELLSMENVKTTDNLEEIPKLLKEMGVEGYAKYNVPKLETTLYQDEADGTNYYYLFNDVSTFAGMLNAGSSKVYKSGKYGEAIENAEITLTGKGTPYVLDAMTGRILSIVDYTDNGDGTLTLKLDNLEPGESTVIAISESEAFTADGEYTAIEEQEEKALNLNEADWNIVLDSYGPAYEQASEMTDEETGIQTVDPSETKVTTLDLGSQRLGNLADIQVSDEQLAELGVESMDQVSGKVNYTTTFNWDGGNANLHFAYGNDQITGVTVNETKLPVVNNLTDTADISQYLKEGENTITIELATTLSKRATVEHMALEGGAMSLGGEDASVETNGLSEVVLVPYVQE